MCITNIFRYSLGKKAFISCHQLYFFNLTCFSWSLTLMPLILQVQLPNLSFWIQETFQVWEGNEGRLQADMGLPLPTSLLHVSATHCTMKARYPSASGVLRAPSLHVHLHVYCHLKGARGSQWKVRSR